MQVACVLKSGPEYGPQHVEALAKTVLAHNDVSMVCLTDIDFSCAGVKCIPLRHRFNGWWSKIELFNLCREPTLYLDIDTVVVGKLPGIGPRFTMLADVYRKGDFGSGVMSWQESPVHIYHKFLKNPLRYMTEYRTRKNWGDQAFIRDSLGCVPDVFSTEFRSYKVHCKNKVPHETKVVYFHGKPRPWDVKLCLS